MDIFERIQELNKIGIVIDCIAINQIDNGNEKGVKEGVFPLITYTVEVMDTSLGKMFYTESCDSFKEAIEAGVKFAEKLV
jgi:hypothetical protein